MARSWAVALAAVALTVGAVGCGDDDSGGGSNGSKGDGPAEQDGPTLAEDKAAVREVAEASFDALYGDEPGSVCDYFTDSYQQQVVHEAKGGEGFGIEGDSCEEVMVAGAALVKGFGAEKPVVGKITVKGDSATAVSTSNGETQTNILVRDGDSWLVDGEKESQETGEPGEPTAAEVKQWPEKWCQVQPGMTKEEVIAIMGQPTDQHEGTNPQVSYYAFEYGFTAFFGVDGTVRQLDANTIRLTEEQIAAIPCETTRTN